ncbi:hypothetical protein B296_00037638 [Ensete ventricosum]|uniref:Uncharacterized protein n=1 Tax=Ensete ventricosum TaxID=4639 RepID=A0A426YZP0_ENSVE|nr:hypothetical protein B296_00037638 [Ensete ventricosum]
MEDELLKSARDIEAVWSELQAAPAKAIIEYKYSPRFKMGLQRTGLVSYEYDYQVALARFGANYPDLLIEEDPFTNPPKDENILMEVEQPFDDSLPPEN